MTGVWVIAHECGHQAFSESKTINDLVGLVCHSALLVPYHSWRITHAKHHNNTGSCENDEVFCPKTRTQGGKAPMAADDVAEVVHEAPLVQLLWIVFMLTLGWMPGYLCFNATGPSKYNGFAKSHFNPWAKVRRCALVVSLAKRFKDDMAYLFLAHHAWVLSPACGTRHV